MKINSCNLNCSLQNAYVIPDCFVGFPFLFLSVPLPLPLEKTELITGLMLPNRNEGWENYKARTVILSASVHRWQYLVHL